MEFVKYWGEGFDVVYGKRVSRKGETVLKKATAHLFYRFADKLIKPKMPADTGDFRLLSRRAVDALKQIREHHRFMKGLFAWIGYSQKAVPYERQPRYSGRTKWNYWRLWNFALEGFTSFTIAPLKIASYLGLLIAAGAFLFMGKVIYKKLVFGDPVQGYASMMAIILFLGGAQLTALGIIGEYIGRIFNETKQRPLYLVKTYAPSLTSILSLRAKTGADGVTIRKVTE
jgi:polyisoprenyl-phosphate glycosyltransferase